MHKRSFEAVRWGLINLLLLYVPLVLLTPQPAQAYVDPGSGAFIYQAISAACIGGLYYFRRFLSRFFKRRR